MPTPRECIRRTIETWEGLFQAFTWDPGNYVTAPNGSQRLVGTMRGVTPGVLAAHRGMKPWEMTETIMKSVTLDEAAEIGEVRYYKGTGLDLLPWGPATDVLVDIGWGSGPRQAILFAQRLAGVKDDGVIGPITVAAFSRWLEDVGWEGAVRAIHEKRMAFYRALGQQNPAKFGPPQQGWKNRADWMLPGGAWWSHWKDALPSIAVAPATLPKPLPAEEAAPVAPPPEAKPVVKSRNFWIAVTQWFTGATTAAGGLSLTDLSTQVGPATAIFAFIKQNLNMLLLVGGIAMAVSFLHVLVKLSEERAKREAQ